MNTGDLAALLVIVYASGAVFGHLFDSRTGTIRSNIGAGALSIGVLVLGGAVYLVVRRLLLT